MTNAIQFFEDNQAAVAAYGLAILADREERRLFAQGRNAIDAALKTVKTERVVLDEEEIIPVLEEYLRSYTKEGQVKVFDRKVAKEGMSLGRRDRTASAMAVHGQICFVDSYNTSIVKSFDRMGNTLRGLLQSYNAKTGTNRFTV